MSKGHKCAIVAAEVSTVYTLSKQLKRKVFSCVLKVSKETSVDRCTAGRLFHVDGSQSAKLVSP